MHSIQQRTAICDKQTYIILEKCFFLNDIVILYSSINLNASSALLI
jgi:hypothetical protein